MLKLSKRRLLLLIQRTLFLSVGFFCYSYSVWITRFAEIHIQLKYLDFPIFIGEILLCFCLVLLVIQYCVHPFRINLWLVGGVVVYGVWVLVKAFGGYVDGGPLAFRNAALFYYPFFILFGFAIFDKGLFNSGWRWAAFGFIFVNLLFVTMNDYFTVVYLALTFGFFYHLKNNWVKALGILAVIFYIYQSNIMWWGIRSHLVGIGLMLTFLAAYFVFGMWRARWLRKIILGAMATGLAVILLFTFCDRDVLKSILNVSHLRAHYSQLNKVINLKKKDYAAESLTVNLYNASLAPVSIFEKVMTLSELAKVLPTQYSPHSNVEYLIKNESSSLQINPGEPNQNLSYPSSLTQQEFNQNDSRTVINREIPVNFESPKSAMLGGFSETTIKPGRDLDIMYNNILFRIFIWRDMMVDLEANRAWWGMSFGHPQRSSSIEILDWATTEWRRDGWITPHNSFLHMIYRGGIVGVLCVFAIIGSLIYLTVGFLKQRSVWGGLLLACLVYWIGISNFLVFLEFPYNAIPFWTFFGMTIAYHHTLKKEKIPGT